ncbi:hypothetical protein FW754_09765 [Acinetobacter sp. 1207_04]|uniref:hypothetical protein n=1 Tax=Acinetobacter sp. 1207_04 TaxID=2604449 RepID=UPI0030406260
MKLFSKICVLALCVGNGVNTQAQQNKMDEPIRVDWDAQGKFENKIKELTGLGEWSYLELYIDQNNRQESIKFLSNKNVKNDRLMMKFNCIEPNAKPSFLIEDKRGLDRLSSNDEKEIDILLDGKSYKNPFIQTSDQLEKFQQALMTAKIIQFNADTFGSPFKFSNQNAEITNKKVNCET